MISKRSSEGGNEVEKGLTRILPGVEKTPVPIIIDTLRQMTENHPNCFPRGLVGERRKRFSVCRLRRDGELIRWRRKRTSSLRQPERKRRENTIVSPRREEKMKGERRKETHGSSFVHLVRVERLNANHSVATVLYLLGGSLLVEI